MFFKCLGEPFAGALSFKSKAAGKQPECARVGWQGIGLLVICDLQVMFDGTQEDVSLAECACFGRGDQFFFTQLWDSLQRAACANGGMRQLQGLHHKFNVPDRTFSEFDFAPFSAFFKQKVLSALLHGEYPGPHVLGGDAIQQGFNFFAQFLSKRQIARNRA